MRRLNGWVALSAVAIGLIGCGQKDAGPVQAARGGIAVVDLEAVAKQTGKTQEIVDSVRLRENVLNQKLLQAQQKFRDQITKASEGFGEAPTPEQKQQLARMQAEANNRLAQAKRNAESAIAQYRQQLIAQFRSDVKPIVETIAAEKGLGAVLPRNEGLLLSVSPGLDITAEVTAAVQAHRPQATAPAADAAFAKAPAEPTTRVAAKPMPTGDVPAENAGGEVPAPAEDAAAAPADAE